MTQPQVSKPVEIVARAICDDQFSQGAFDRAPQEVKEKFRRHAGVVLAALKPERLPERVDALLSECQSQAIAAGQSWADEALHDLRGRVWAEIESAR